MTLRAGLTFDAEATRQQDDDDKHDQDGLEPWILADAVFHVVDLVCGKWRIGIDPRKEGGRLGVAVEDGHFGVGTRSRCHLWILGKVGLVAEQEEGDGDAQSNDEGYIAGRTVR